MARIIKEYKKKSLHQRIHPETNKKLQELSKKTGLYIIELIDSLVDREHSALFDKVK